MKTTDQPIAGPTRFPVSTIVSRRMGEGGRPCTEKCTPSFEISPWSPIPRREAYRTAAVPPSKVPINNPFASRERSLLFFVIFFSLVNGGSSFPAPRGRSSCQVTSLGSSGPPMEFLQWGEPNPLRFRIVVSHSNVKVYNGLGVIGIGLKDEKVVNPLWIETMAILFADTIRSSDHEGFSEGIIRGRDQIQAGGVRPTGPGLSKTVDFRQRGRAIW